ncbi:MAG: monovalent cation/H(+) antiporter subunit G [Candidatus Cloacimonadota bacterium]|nr:monovalent cation/H(+) antiporter subunit G [Candidatus Cloacimonadota bacterium]
MELAGSIITLIGSIFLFLGALGIVRMPDIYNRMQSGTKATTLGSILFMVGIAVGFAHCTCLPKIIILILFIIFTNPISSHALARAAHHIGIPLTKKSVKDDLLADEEGEKK